jgi:ribosomal protein S8
MLLFYFVLSLKMANKQNKNFIYVYPNKKIISFVGCLFFLGFISGFALIKKDLTGFLVLKIYLKNSCFLKSSFLKIIFLSTLNKSKFISNKNLNLIYSRVFFIDTVFGFTTTNTAKKLNSGGRLAFFLC